MKNLKSLVLLFLVATVSLVSCNKDDDDATPAAAALEGKWQYSKQGVSAGGQESLQDYSHSAGCTKDYVEVLSAGVFKEHNFFGTSCTEDVATGTWTRNGSTYTYILDGETYTEEIVELTSTTLKTKEVFGGVNYITVYTRL
jgi:Lipocalin-like domain